MLVKNSERSCAISCGHRQSSEYKDSREKKEIKIYNSSVSLEVNNFHK